MRKKYFIFALIFIVLITFSGCPDKDTSSKKENESEKIPNSMKKAATELEQVVTLLGGPMFDGRDRIEQLKSQQMQALINITSENKEKSSSGTESAGKSQQTGEQKQNEEQKKGSEQGSKDSTGKNEENQNGESSDSNKESESKTQEEGKNTQEENTTKDFETNRPGSELETTGDFRFGDSLFGIPQWQEENWKMLQVLTDGLYFSWNSIQPILFDKGVSNIQSDSFSTELEALSKAVKNQRINDARIAAYKLTELTADFFSFYKTAVPPELQRIKSTVTGIHFYAKQSDWEKSQDLAMKLRQELTGLKSRVENSQSYVFKMFEFSLEDLEKSVQKQDSALVLIRTNLVTTNIQELESELSQAQSQ